MEALPLTDPGASEPALQQAPIPRTAVSVVIPAYNEEAIVADVIRQAGQALEQAGIECEIMLIDDGSTDGTAREAEQTLARVIRHGANRGYGAALKTGFCSARHELVCMLDADGTYPVSRLPELIREAEDQDMVVGARTDGAASVPWVRRGPKWFLNILANYLTGMRIPDLNSGMRVIRRRLVLDYIDILPDRFSFTTTITLAGLCDGYRVKFVPVEYHRRVGKSKIRSVDAFNFLILILRTMALFRPLRMFLAVALLLFAGAAVKLSIDVFVYDDIEDASVILLLGGLQTLFVGMLADLMCFVRRRSGPGVRLRPVDEEIRE
jgi:glycosyltransferase involved in cell wall biosynthesis